jgi:hypothetical protein
MEGLENKSKRHGINDTKGQLVDRSPFTTFALTKNYEVKIHHDKDDDNLCFILWLHESRLFKTMFWV